MRHPSLRRLLATPPLTPTAGVLPDPRSRVNGAGKLFERTTGSSRCLNPAPMVPLPRFNRSPRSDVASASPRKRPCNWPPPKTAATPPALEAAAPMRSPQYRRPMMPAARGADAAARQNRGARGRPSRRHGPAGFYARRCPDREHQRAAASDAGSSSKCGRRLRRRCATSPIRARNRRAGAASSARRRRPADIDPQSVEGLKSAAVPLIMSFDEEQKQQVRDLAHVMGLDQLASQF